MFAKTTAVASRKTIEYIRAAPPDEEPEIMILLISDGLPEFLDWVTKESSNRN